MNLKEYIRSIPDYPKKGILFRARNLKLIKLQQLNQGVLFLLLPYPTY